MHVNFCPDYYGKNTPVILPVILVVSRKGEWQGGLLVRGTY